MTYVKVNGNRYPAEIRGKLEDREWDGRESKAITLEGSYAEVDTLFAEGATWSIVMNDGEDEAEFDNSEFTVRGDLTVHTDGTCTVKMGKPTDLEAAYEMLYGGERE